MGDGSWELGDKVHDEWSRAIGNTGPLVGRFYQLIAAAPSLSLAGCKAADCASTVSTGKPRSGAIHTSLFKVSKSEGENSPTGYCPRKALMQ